MCQTKPERSKIQTKAVVSSSTVLPKGCPFSSDSRRKILRNTEEQREETRAVRSSVYNLNVYL